MRQVTIQFGENDMWLLNFVEDIVKMKEQTGLGDKTSAGKEIIRLAKNSLLKTAKGAKLDQIVINSKRGLNVRPDRTNPDV